MSKKRDKKKTKQKEVFSFKSEYLRCYSFLKDARNYLYFVILIFFIFVVIGFFYQDLVNLFFKNVLGQNLNEQILSYLKNLLIETEGMSNKELIGFIFLNNLQSSFLGVVFGIIFGIFPLITAIINGYVLGFVAILSVKEQGFTILWRILPHGIFELPAIFISMALGIKLGTYLFTAKESFKNLLINSLRVFLLVIFPLLLIAAIIEGTLIVLGGG